MKTGAFTYTDYITASALRSSDCLHLKANKTSVIFSLYCAGVAVECMLRAYITKETREFDSKHDLTKLYEKSKIALVLNSEEKEAMTNAVKILNKFWDNNLRYTSDKRMKRFIAHESAHNRTEFRDINKHLTKHYSEVFDASALILKIGNDKWN